MAKPVITTNFSDVTKLEGLYILEVTPPSAIGGVSLNTVCYVGETVKGPVGEAVEISSAQRFLDVFGGRDLGAGGPVLNKVWLSTTGKKLGAFKVVRVVGSGAGTATGQDTDGYLQCDATSPGVWANGGDLVISNATDGDADHFNATFTDAVTGRAWKYQNLDISGSNDNLAATVGDDEANPIALTKLDSGRPVNQTITLAGGTSPSVVDSDYTTTNGPLEIAANEDDVDVVTTANYMSGAIKAKMAALAGESSDRMFLISADSSTVSASSAEADADGYRSDRLIYCFNHPTMLDPNVGVNVTVSPCDAMAQILSLIDVDIHPGDPDTQAFLTWITGLSFPSLGRGDYEALRAAGISALEKDSGAYDFLSGRTTSLEPGKEEITRRRMCDFINLSLAASTLKYQVKKKDTLSRRHMIVGLIHDFLADLQKQERVVEDFSVDGEILNTPSLRSQGIEQELIEVKLINHILSLVAVVEAGTNVTITEKQ